MSSISFASIIYYSFFSMFAFYLQGLSREFRGASKILHFFIALFGFLGLAIGIIYLGYYGWNVSWVGAGIQLICGIIFAGSAGLILEKFIGPYGIAMSGLIGLPTAAILMFLAIPKI